MRSSRPHPASRSGHTQTDHGGSRVTLPLRTPPGIDYSHIHAALPNRRLRTYRGGKDVGVRGEGYRNQGRDSGWRGGKGADQVVEGGGSISTSVPRRDHRRGDGLAGGGINQEMGRGLPQHRPCGGDLEGGGSDSQSTFHRRHHLPRLTPWIPGGSRYGDHHP